LPYYFPKPIQKRLEKYALDNEGIEVDMSKYVLKIVRDFLVDKGLLTPIKDCLHEHIYESKSTVCCWDCGLTWETKFDAEVAQRLKKKNIKKEEIMDGSASV